VIPIHPVVGLLRLHFKIDTPNPLCGGRVRGWVSSEQFGWSNFPKKLLKKSGNITTELITNPMGFVLPGLQ